MKQILLVVVSCVAAFAVRLRADELPWQFEYDKALEAAKAQHKPVLVDFSASWCGPCRMMETTTFANPEVRAALSEYILVKVDLDRNSSLAARYGVNAIPACFVLNQFGEKVDQRVGYADALTFNQWLDGAKPGAAAAESKYQALAERIKKLSQGLESADAGTRDKAVAGLLETCCTPQQDDSGEAKAAETELRAFTQKRPELAAGYLNEPRLAARILFAKLLADKAGGEFKFDPWAPAEERAAAAADWTKRAAVR